ncbi:hypothetical protein [Pedobacter rhizosphaerae]|uniref:Uncharacterized protein n=1 Tax=Pedobacter rhizosphaerae TaxID=390241 RepID=A0A1H9RZK1_9SPHI|nr:hypothetical protein [Pedobacter rhizosphaerae]SER78114.1 hypothetical protein SAMN04488023_11651 [Pedobacter rhizosphaerae]
MNNITPYPVLAHVVNMIENVISGIKIQYTAEGVVTLKDGNDTIHLEQKNDGAGNFATIFIKDPRDIIFSEDLFPSLKNLHQGTSGDLKLELQNTTVIINDLDVETQIILEEAKDEFDQISNSYEFVKTIEKEGNKLKSSLKFGNNSFILSLINDADQILVSPEFASSFDATVRKTIESDTLKVQEELNASFK